MKFWRFILFLCVSFNGRYTILPRGGKNLSTWTFTPSVGLFPRGKQYENSLLIDSSTCLHLVLSRPFGYFFMTRLSIIFSLFSSIVASFFCFLGALIIEEPLTFVWIALEVVAILLSFLITIIVTILSHIWCISLAILFGIFVTLNFPFLQLFKCKLLSTFEISRMIPTCDVENGTKWMTTTFYKSSL